MRVGRSLLSPPFLGVEDARTVGRTPLHTIRAKGRALCALPLMTRLPGARSLCKNGGGDAKRRREKARIEVEIPRQKLLEMYEKLLLARFVDDKLYELNTTGVFTGWLHLAAGEEAMPVAVGAVLRKDDYLKPQGRGAHGNVAKGMPLVNVFAGMMGRRVEGGGRRGSE